MSVRSNLNVHKMYVCLFVYFENRVSLAQLFAERKEMKKKRKANRSHAK